MSDATTITRPDLSEADEAQVAALHAKYSQARERLRSAQHPVGFQLLGAVTRDLSDRFLEENTDRISIFVAPLADDGLVGIFICGEGNGVHSVLANLIHKHVMKTCFKSMDGIRRFHDLYHSLGPMDCVRFNRHKLHCDRIRPGMVIKAPDWCIAPDGRPYDMSVVEVAFASETREEVVWELLLWSQQGSSAQPARHPMNVLAIKVETEAASIQNSNKGPAFVLCIFGKADAAGCGVRRCIITNGTPELKRAWEEVFHKWQLQGVEVEMADNCEIPFDFCAPSASEHWDVDSLAIHHDDLRRAFETGKALDHAYAARLNNMSS